MNNWYRRAPAVCAALLLSVPSASGVYRTLEPIRGPIAAGCAAAGFEAVYLSTALLLLTPDLQRYARNVALVAVAAAVLLNTLADYAARVPGGLANSAAFLAMFDLLALALSLIESAPLAGLAYAMAGLLHRLAESGHADQAPAVDDPAPSDIVQTVAAPDHQLTISDSEMVILSDRKVSWTALEKATGVARTTIRYRLDKGADDAGA